MFDDSRVGLNKEPFVSDADTMIDVLVADTPSAQQGFRLLFSATPFPSYTVKPEWQREEYSGNWYFSSQLKMEGWLCSALFNYFDKAPKVIYVKAEPKARFTKRQAVGRYQVVGSSLADQQNSLSI